MVKHSKKQTITVRPFNPFSVTIEGLTLLFSRAQSVTLFLIAVIIVGFVFNMTKPSPEFTNDPTGKATEEFIRNALQSPPEVQLTWLGMGIILALFTLAITTMLHGIASYAALQLSKGYDVKLGEAFNAVLENFGRYFILFFIMNLKIFLWTLLFIVPGIIAYYRYSFAGIMFFDEDKKLRGNAALVGSSKLAKKGLLTLFASQFLFNVITFFYADRLITLGSQAVLYREYTALENAKADKPKPHVISKLALALPFIVIIGMITFSALIFTITGLSR